VIVSPLSIAGAMKLSLERKEDERGYFARTFCVRELERHGLSFSIVQMSTSFNRLRGTIRGLHWQAAPNEERKIVRCVRGAIYDVIVDVRQDSPTYMRYVAVELTYENADAVLIPAGCAHGFQTLADDTEVHYAMDVEYAPSASRVLRYDDAALAIGWPLKVSLVSDRDRRGA
jgi:dTDP-4-dehydrorhamnose 3,5-epimerase